MSANASLTIVGGPQRIEPGHETTLTAQIVNLGTTADDFRLSVREVDPAWVTFRPPTVYLQPGAQATARIVLRPPVGLPPGSIQPIFRLLSRRAGNVAIIEIALPPPGTGTARPVQTAPQPEPPVVYLPPEPPPATPAVELPITATQERSQPVDLPTPPRGIPDVTVTVPPRESTPNREPTVSKESSANTRFSQTLLLRILLGLALVLLVAAGTLLLLNRQQALPEPAPTATAEAVITPVPLLPTATVAGPAPATPSRAVTVAAAKTFVVANTGGDGVYLRRTTNLDDHDTAYIEGTQLVQVGPDIQANGITWRHVRTPDGKTGYVPAQYTQEAP